MTEHTVGALTEADVGLRFTWRALGSDTALPFTAILTALHIGADGNVESASFRADADGQGHRLPASELIWYVEPL